MYKIYISKHDIRKEIFNLYGINEKDILHNEHGKPYVNKENFYFSISHSKEYFSIVVGDNNCGIDIEVKDLLKEGRYLDISKRIFSTSVQEKINSLDTFYRMWVRNEAYTKYIGDSIFRSKKEDISLYEISNVKITDIFIFSNLYLSLAYEKGSSVEVIFWE